MFAHVRSRSSFFPVAGAVVAILAASASSAFAQSQTDSTPGLFDASSGTRILTFTAADFGGNAGALIDPNMFTFSINFAKADGESFAPPYPTGTPFYNEIVFQLTDPTGTTVNLINGNSFGSGSGPGFDGTITFTNNATNLVNVDPNQPQAGTFRPIDGNFNAFAGHAAVGTYTLFIADTVGADALRYRTSTLSIGPGGNAPLTPEAPAMLNMAAALLAPGIGGIVTLRKRRKKAA